MIVPEISAQRIVSAMDSWRRALYPTWRLENMIVSYANGGPPPADVDDNPDDAITITPLGFAQTRMKQEVGPRLDVISMEPGMIDGVYRTPAIKDDPDRTTRVQTVVPTQINAVVQKQLKAVMTEAAGRTTVTGRAYIYWTSPNDWQPKSGRLIYPSTAGINEVDSEFREWGFMGRISLRQIDAILKDKPNPDRMGWCREGLENLKMWILASQAQRYNFGNSNASGIPGWAQEYNPETWLGYDLENCCYGVEPVDVYWYFRKNGKLTKNDPDYGGDEEVDLYCVSRFGNDSKVSFTVKDMERSGRLDINYDKTPQEWLKKRDSEYRRREGLSEEEANKERNNERLLFHSKGFFKSVRDCLVCDISDCSVAGEQKMGEVKGAGKTMMPKLAAMEGLMAAIIEGAAFGVSVNWTVQDGTDPEYLDQLSRYKNRPGQAFPQGISPMQKNNAFQGLGQVGALIGQLDAGIAADSLAGASSAFGRSSPDFVDEAREQLSQKQGTLLRSLQSWYETLDAVVKRVTRALCRPLQDQKQAYASYQDALKLAGRLINYEQVGPDEWEYDRWDYKARRLAGSMSPQQAVSTYRGLIQDVGQFMPNLVPFFAQQILRARVGDTIAAQLTNPGQEQQKGQQESAQEKVTNSYVLMQPAQPGPMDDPVIHAGVASQAAQMRIQLAQQSGRVSQDQVQGIMAVLGYAASQIQRIPDGQMAMAGMQQIRQMAKAAQSLQVMNAEQEPMTDYQKATLELKSRGQGRMEDVDAMKAQQIKFNQFKDLKTLGLKEDMNNEMLLNMANQRAANTLETQRKLTETDAKLSEEALPADALAY